MERIEESGRFEPSLGPDEVKPTLDHMDLMEADGDDELLDEPAEPEPGLDDLPEPDEEF